MSRPRPAPATRAAVPPFAVMSILNRVAELRAAGRDVVSLCAGEPSAGAPSDVRARMTELMGGVPLGYTETFGIRPLRAALAGHYARWYGLDVDPDAIAVTTGSSGAFTLAFLAAFDAGDRVALARPGYPAYRNILTALGCEVVELDCGPEQRFSPDVTVLEAAHARAPLAGLVLASPANPTGTMVDAQQLAALAGWCAEHGVRLVSDEIYHGITASGEAGSCAWAVDRDALVISSFSKFWGMTGWRLGWCLVPADLRPAFDALAGNFALCAPVPAQHAAVAAFTDRSYAEAAAAGRTFDAARAVLLAALPSLGWGAVAPADGAFYVYAELGAALADHVDSVAWCAALLEREGVALTPGTDFDTVRGGSAVRVSLAAGPDAVAEAVTRIRRFQS
ncbi:Aspartate/methionine/tyrosine aminotransferase [Friedmanniella luteola]|uniref:Aminotransferase n=1 Tax=Friedmanniella luteola TaxID=546871 RepID=A0A1H2A188_9ACTN|nr:aminotransferase class I/II-fold pyridoxal phosphate-dependent enzyme [Friedmanniella luteola]SDT39462.1 Aspartate/methionine/tyrosine aminotransferase [Friedmanniella luteola]